MPQNHFNDEVIALQNFFKNKDLIIQESVKGKSEVIIDRIDYIKKMETILSNQNRFTIVNLKDDTLLNFDVNQEKQVDKVLERLVESNSITEKNKKSLKPVGIPKSLKPDSHFIFDGTLYKQIDGVAMGSHLDPALANNFLVHHVKN